MGTSSSSSRVPDSCSSSRAFEPVERISSYHSHLLRWKEYADTRFKLRSYVFVGQRTGNIPVRMAFIAGLRSRDRLATGALANLLLELEVAALAAADYALFSYAITAESDLDVGSDSEYDFLRESAPEKQTIAGFVETDLERNDVDGVISIATNEYVSGFQFETDSELIATEVARPSLDVAGRFVPLADEPVKVLPPDLFVYQRGGGRTVPKQIFGLTIRTPKASPPDDQVAAIVFSSIRVLQRYRKLWRSTIDF